MVVPHQPEWLHVFGGLRLAVEVDQVLDRFVADPEGQGAEAAFCRGIGVEIS